MNNAKFYIDTVLSKHPDASATCRPVIVSLRGANVLGYIIGDMYFINSKTMEVCEKTDCALINYIDDFDD